jgi:energy-coupling factor transporter transmembrane protein EcfT
MKNLPKGIFSLLIALLFVAIILILPDADLSFKNQLNFLTKSDNAAIAFGYYLIQKVISGALVVFLTIAISIAGHRALKKYRSEF